MICILTEISFSNICDQPNIKKYIDNCDYFSLKTDIKHKKQIYDEMWIWIDWYAIYSNKPLYLVIMTDNMWYYYTRNNELKHKCKLTHWKLIPAYADEWGKNKPLFMELRMWNSRKYFRSICDNIEKEDFTGKKIKQVKLDGNINEIEDITDQIINKI